MSTILNPLSAAVEPTDADLVALSRNGDRNSFGRIVGRYQSLVCAITYSSCGNVAQSEDLAQEVFLSAWKQLHGLREPERLKQWLGGIARQAAIQTYRRNRREPTHLAAELPPDAPAPELAPFESAIRREEQQLLWRALERLPVTYREALVLYYREHRSIEHVACALDLSEENVRQRLSRGRKALQDEIAAMLDGALSTSAPGGLFTSVVVAALPHLTPVGSVAVGGAAAKGSAIFKTTFAGLTGSAAWTTGSFFALLGMFTQFRTAQTSGERRRTLSKWSVLWFGCIVYAAGLCALSLGSPGYWFTHPHARTATVVAAAVVYVLSVAIFLWRCAAGWVWAESGSNDRVAGVAPLRLSEPHYEFCSRTRLLGLPLIHIRYRLHGNGAVAPAKGWVAIGNVAYGAVFACGGLTVAPISCGILSLGLVSVGGFATGGFAFGFIALGFYSVGGMAAGFLAYGGSALGWMAAGGSVAVAHDFALGGATTTLAAHANDTAAQRAMADLFLFRHSQSLLSVCLALAWMPLLFSLWWRRRGRNVVETGSP